MKPHRKHLILGFLIIVTILLGSCDTNQQDSERERILQSTPTTTCEDVATTITPSQIVVINGYEPKELLHRSDGSVWRHRWNDGTPMQINGMESFSWGTKEGQNIHHLYTGEYARFSTIMRWERTHISDEGVILGTENLSLRLIEIDPVEPDNSSEEYSRNNLPKTSRISQVGSPFFIADIVDYEVVDCSFISQESMNELIENTKSNPSPQETI